MRNLSCRPQKDEVGVERKNLRQIAGGGFRRWFSDEYFDLIVWYEGEAQADSAMTLSTQARSRVNSI